MNIQSKTVLVFALKFVVVAPFVWLIWWWILPQYAWVIGQLAGTLISVAGTNPIEAMRVETGEALVLNAKTMLVYTYQGRDLPFDIASLVSNLPPLIILVLATPAIKLRRAIRAILIGIPIIALGHVGFITSAFLLQDQISKAPEIPTGIGYVLLTLPFVLWIVLVHWETVSDYMGAPKEDPPAES